MRNDKPAEPEEVPVLILPKSLTGLKRLYRQLLKQLEDEQGLRMAKIPIGKIRDKGVLQKMIGLFWRLIHDQKSMGQA